MSQHERGGTRCYRQGCQRRATACLPAHLPHVLPGHRPRRSTSPCHRRADLSARCVRRRKPPLHRRDVVLAPRAWRLRSPRRRRAASAPWCWDGCSRTQVRRQGAPTAHQLSVPTAHTHLSSGRASLSFVPLAGRDRVARAGGGQHRQHVGLQRGPLGRHGDQPASMALVLRADLAARYDARASRASRATRLPGAGQRASAGIMAGMRCGRRPPSLQGARAVRGQRAAAKPSY